MSILRDLLTGPRSALMPLAPKGLPTGTRIRVYRQADRQACVEIYNENEPGRFPPNVGGQFEQFLDHPGYLKLVSCIGEQPVAIGGIVTIPSLFSGNVWLAFGMVKPALHRNGIGTAMLLARLAALSRPLKPVRVMLTSIADSAGFLARFGFTYQGQMAIPASGTRLEVKSAILDADGWEVCRGLLQRIGIEPTSLPSVPSADIWHAQPPPRHTKSNT